MNFTVLNKQLAYYVHDKAWYENQKESSVQSLWRHASSQLSVSDHTTSASVAVGFSSPPEGLPFSHTTRDGIKDPCPRFSDVLLAYDVFHCGLLESFSAKKQCVKHFRLLVKKWWWLSSPLLKVVVTCHHQHIQGCAYGFTCHCLPGFTCKLPTVLPDTRS